MPEPTVFKDVKKTPLTETKEQLTMDGLEKAIRLIRTQRRCGDGFVRQCGCGMIHDILFSCFAHHKLLVEHSELLWNDAHDNGVIVKELFGLKIKVVP